MSSIYEQRHLVLQQLARVIRFKMKTETDHQLPKMSFFEMRLKIPLLQGLDRFS